MGLNKINSVLFMSKTSKIQCMKFNSVNGTHVEDVEDIKIHVFLSFAAIHTVARGHELVAQGWAAFEQTCTEVGVGELPQLLQYVKTHITTTPTATPVKEEVKEEEEAMDVEPAKKEEGIIEKPIHVSFGGQTVEYRCGNCDIAPRKSKAGMDAHIRSVHTKKALLCSFCAFSTYNYDSLNRHMKEHN